MHVRRNQRVAALMVGVAVLAACNGDDDTATTTSLPAPTTVAPESTAPSTAAPPTSTVPPTTSPPETTISTTAAPTTTPPPTTSPSPPTTAGDVDAAIQARLDVVEAVDASFEASIRVRRDPLDQDQVDGLSDYFTGNQLEGWRNIVERYRDQNRRLLVNPLQADGIEVELASLAVNGSLDFATVQVCEILAGVLVEVGGNADGSDRVVADGIERTVIELEVVRDGQAWKVSSASEPAEQDRIASCDT